ncbi:hypothetical protein Tdes44962_MAKER09417 [Teratosphaeria destructans]|uniref:Uncharacterized protein n=1 Tax=Teratosphaeria destructans TaxID=418781 RepID=A0A9W7W3A9_9PEZI|nr:hypothetical protein Tdes44962_MAKER09417 [Teratosphaeria destructans]
MFPDARVLTRTRALWAGRREAALGSGAVVVAWRFFSMPPDDVVQQAARMVRGRSCCDDEDEADIVGWLLA